METTTTTRSRLRYKEGINGDRDDNIIKQNNTYLLEKDNTHMNRKRQVLYFIQFHFNSSHKINHLCE